MHSKNLLEPIINKLLENRNTVVQITVQDHPLHVVNVGKVVTVEDSIWGKK